MMPNYVLVLVFSITIYIVCSSFLNTYLFSKAKKTGLLASYLVVALFMSLWSAVKLLEIVSPTAEIKLIHIQIQYVLALLLIIGVAGFLLMVSMKRRASKKIAMCLTLGMITFSLLLLLHFELPLVAATYILILQFSVLNLSVFFYRHQIFPETEISLDTFVNHIDDRVAVFDLAGNLVDMNLRALQEVLIPTGSKTLVSFLEKIKRYSNPDNLNIDAILSMENTFESEVCIESEDHPTYYIFHVHVIKNKREEKLGTVCTLRDITENKILSIELDYKNKELQSLNEELDNYIKIADSLEEEKERAQIAREINSTIGQKLTEILSVLEVIKLTSKEDADVFEKPLNEAIERCHEVLSEIRVVVSRLIPEKKKGEK